MPPSSARPLTFLRFRHAQTTILIEVTPKTTTLDSLREQLYKVLQSQPIPSPPLSSSSIRFYHISTTPRNNDNNQTTTTEPVYSPIEDTNLTLEKSQVTFNDGDSIALSFEDEKGNVPEPFVADPASVDEEEGEEVTEATT